MDNMSTRDRILASRNPSKYSDEFADDEQGGGSMGGDISYTGDDDVFGGGDDIFGGGSGGDSFGGGFTSGGAGGFGGQSAGSSGFGGQPAVNAGFGGQPVGNAGFGGVQQGAGFGGQPDGFGGQSSGFGGMQPVGGYGQQNNGFGSFGNTYAPGGMVAQQQAAQPGRYDQAVDAMFNGAGSTFELMKEMVSSFSNRNADDWGTYSKNLMTAGGAFAAAGAVTAVIGLFGDFSILSFAGLPLNMLLSGALCVGTSFMGIGGAAFKLLNIDDEASCIDIDQVADVEDGGNSESLLGSTDDDVYDDDFESLLAGLEDGDDDDNTVYSTADPFDNDQPAVSNTPEPEVDPFEELRRYKDKLNQAVQDTPENIPIIDRRYLVELFKPRLLINTPDFSKVTTYDENDEKFKSFDTTAVEAMAQAAGKTIEDIGGKIYLASLSETLFSYTLKVKRDSRIKIADNKIQEEFEAYFSEPSANPMNPDEGKVSVIVEKDKDLYSIRITKSKGISVVTLGDCLSKPEVSNYFLDPKHRLPLVVGITDLGVPILEDARNLDASMIAGKPRSGKSWYVNSIVLQLQLFNTPEEVQFLYIDPKESYLFKCLSYMPHCCGIHNHKRTLEILDDIINKEGPRRKKLMQDNQCDTIWALRDKGIKIPVLYVVMDEYMTIADYYSERASELKGAMQVILSQFPSAGIRLLFVPHRAQGVVDKTSRSLLPHVAAIKADNEIVRETLDAPRWSRRLSQPGDMALRINDRIMFARGAAVETSDERTVELIKSIAKTFYKMGIEIPDMSTIGYGYNRDEAAIKEALQVDSGTGKIQYDATRMQAELDLI